MSPVSDLSQSSSCDLPPLKNDRLIRAIKRQPVDATPVWIMRQAGRYLPEYRAIRKQAGSFLNLCHNPEMACEVTLQPLAHFELDAAIIFSDILTIPHAMGLGLYFEENEGPKFKRPISSPADIQQLPRLNASVDLDFVMQALRLTRQTLNGKVPLIGFAGSPWTLATYMVEGGSSKHFTRVKSFALNHPDSFLELLDKLAEATADYLLAQIASGAQVVQLFDSWGGALSDGDFKRYSLNNMCKIVSMIRAVHPEFPIIVFTKGGGLWLDDLADCGADALGLDWTINIGKARQQVGSRVALQGNLDPAVLNAEEVVIGEWVTTLLADYGTGSGHVFNLGHGIHPHINPDRVKYLVDCVHENSQQYHP